jgi:hypothetical protein
MTKLGQDQVESPRELGYTEHWNFGIQRDLGWDSVLEVSYLGNEGHNYQALNIKAEKRFSHALNFQANYTYAKFIDDVARYNVQFRVEELNFANHPDSNNPGTALGSAGFGVISAARDSRILQLGLRAEF